MFAQHVLSRPASSLFGKRFMATVAVHKPFFGLKIGAAAVIATVLLLAPSEEFDDLDCQNHIFQEDCEHFKHGH